MTSPVRLATRSLLALAFAGLMGLSASAATFAPRAPSVTGAYLAGTQALVDLRTDDAERYFHDALAADWENPLVIERAFVAFAANGNVAGASATARRMLEFGRNDLARLVIGAEAL